MKSYKHLIVVILILFHQQSRAFDLDKIKQNFQDFYILEAISDEKIDALLAEMNPDFSFKDIDYTSHRRSNWKPKQHLVRLIQLATAYQNSKSKHYHSQQMSATVVGALNFWSYNHFYSDNWWHKQIGVPQNLGPTLLICEAIIPDSTRVKSLELMDASKIGMTGQNKIWLSGNVFMRELLRKNLASAKAAADTIKSVVVPSKPYQEGIQPDFSFHQHGPQPQFGNYGLHFAEDIVKWMFIFNQTNIAFSEEKITLMRNLMFKGQQKVVYKGKYEILATGRQLFPEMVNGKTFRGPQAKYNTFKKLEHIFSVFDTKENPTTAPNEYIHFRNSDYSLYRTDTFFSAVRMSSKRIIGAEAGNGENLAGYYLGDGTHLIYRTGDEYHEIYPVWNWKKLPGTTTVQDTAPLPILTWSGYKNNSDYAGGIKGNHVGLTAFKYHRDGLQANKSYFFKGQTVYALGSNIKSTRNFNVVTTINQCYLRGTVFINKQKHLIHSVWHDSIAYVSLTDQQINVKQDIQTGNWKKVLAWHTDTPIAKNIFDIEINHGTQPTSGKYAYASIVGISKKEAKNIHKKQLAKIIAHTKKAHALSFNKGKHIAIAAFEPCTIQVKKHQTITINQPCLLNLTQQKNTWIVEAVDPTQLNAALYFELTGSYQSKNATNLRVVNNTTFFNIQLSDDENKKGKKHTVVLRKK